MPHPLGPLLKKYESVPRCVHLSSHPFLAISANIYFVVIIYLAPGAPPRALLERILRPQTSTGRFAACSNVNLCLPPPSYQTPGCARARQLEQGGRVTGRGRGAGQGRGGRSGTRRSGAGWGSSRATVDAGRVTDIDTGNANLFYKTEQNNILY